MKKNQENRTLLTGFSTDPADYPIPQKIRDWRYCQQHTESNALPCCPILERIINERDISFAEYFLPPDFIKPPQAKTDGEYRFQLIEQLIKVLNWWINEDVRPDMPIFWYYVYKNKPCAVRLPFITYGANALIQSLKYDFPTIAAEIEKLKVKLLKAAHEFDADAKLFRHSGSIKIDREGIDTFTPYHVRESAAVLCGELDRIRQHLDAQKKRKNPPKNELPAESRLLAVLVGNHNASITQICKLAKVSRNTAYKCPNFMSVFRKHSVKKGKKHPWNNNCESLSTTDPNPAD